MIVTPEELFAGGEAQHRIEIPADVLVPGGRGDGEPREMRLRPLTVKDVQLIARAARDDEVLTSILMIARAAVDPPLKQSEVAAMHGGLVRFLVDEVNRISGLVTTEDELRQMTEAPLVQAFFVLAREFSWTPQQVRELTVGQILGYLELLNRRAGRAA